MINTSLINSLKSSVKLSDIIGREIKLKKAGVNEFLTNCPFHNEKTPSFRVYDETGKYYCFGCQAKGDAFDFLKEFRSLDYTEAAEYMGLNTETGEITDIGIPISKVIVTEKTWLPVMPVPSNAPKPNISKLSYIQPEMIHQYKAIDGQFLFGIMRIAATDTKKKMFLPLVYGSDGLWHKDGLNGLKSRPLYGLQKLAKPYDFIIVVEGEKKADKLQEILDANNLAIAVISWSGGSQAVPNTDFSPIVGKKVVMWPDNDKSGEDSAQMISTVINDLYLIPIPEGKDKGWDCYDAITIDGYSIGDIRSTIEKKRLYSDLNHVPEVIVEENEPQLISQKKKSLPKELLNAPGLVGKISKWIGKEAMHPLPELELASAIAAVGIIYAHKVKTRTDLRSNMYVMGVSPSGSGKDHARKCIKSLFYSAGTTDWIGGKPKSGAAILTMAAKNNGRCIVLWDEIGRVLESISGKNSQSYQREISTNIMEIFSSSDTLFLGDELANRDGKTNRVDIEQPCFNIYATTVKDSLYAAMGSKETVDGFLSRWIIFEAENPYIYDDEDYSYEINPPENLIKEVMEWDKKPTNPDWDGKSLVLIKPKIIPYSEDAAIMIRDFKRQVMDRLKTDSNNAAVGQTVFAALWARSPEHAAKLALCGHENDVIDGKVMKWAIDLASFCTEKMLYDIENNISTIEQEALTKKVLEVVRNAKKAGITKGQITRKTQWLTSTQRDNILKDLEVSHQIERQKVKGKFNETDLFYLYGGAPANK